MEEQKRLVGVLKMVASEGVPDYCVTVIRQGAEDGSIHTDCPEELADLLMLLTDVWVNPTIFSMSEEQMARRIELINDLFKPFGIELFHEEMIQLMRECQKVQNEK